MSIGEEDVPREVMALSSVSRTVASPRARTPEGSGRPSTVFCKGICGVGSRKRGGTMGTCRSM